MIRFVIVAGLATSVMLAPASAGNIKKWVDENGVTHYGTAVPPQYKNRAHTELNQRGIAIKRHERAKTAEEIEKEKALEALRAEQQKLLEEQQERDRILLSLYRNEDDLVMARDGKITQLDAQIKLKHGDIRRLKNRLSEFQADAAATERSGKQLNERQKTNLESTQRSIERSYAMILAKEDEKRATLESYDYDLTRFRQLRQGGARAVNADVIAKSDIPDLVDTAVRCTGADCGRLWAIAQEYALKHATTPIDLAAERILVTAPPRDIRDISITVSRLEDNSAGGERIFMDVQCANFTEAREFCRGSEVSEIRNSFRLALEP
jgi:ATP-dependent protease HslVU (ClpYQ) peptidase subunit